MKLLYTVAFLLACTFGAAAQSGNWQPERNVEIVVGIEPGGQADTLARLIDSVIQSNKMIPVSSVVVNKPGQGTRVAINYVNTHQGDGDYLIIGASSALTTAIANGYAKPQDELTPIIKLSDSKNIVFVKTDSPFKTVNDVVAKLKEDVNSVSFAFSTASGNSLHIGLVELAIAAGADPKKLRIVVNNSGALTAPQIAGGHVDVGVGSLSSNRALIEAGQIRVIGIAAETGMDELKGVPTLTEQGFPIVMPSWYVVYGPKGLSANQIAYWSGVIGKVLDSQEFVSYVSTAGQSKSGLAGDDLKKNLDSEWDRLHKALVTLGMAK